MGFNSLQELECGRLFVQMERGPRPRLHTTNISKRVNKFHIDELAVLHHRDLLPNLNKGGDEAVELPLVLRLRRLDHQRVVHRPAHRRGVEAVVLCGVDVECEEFVA